MCIDNEESVLQDTLVVLFPRVQLFERDETCTSVHESCFISSGVTCRAMKTAQVCSI